MDKLILVIYIGVNGLTTQAAVDLVQQYKKIFQKQIEEDIMVFFIPSTELDTCKIECINPKLLNEEEYQLAKDKLKILNQKIDKIVNEI